MALKKEYWQGILAAVVLAVGIYFLAHGCSKNASADSANSASTGQANASGPFDLAISGGRVMDPESKLDAIRNVGIRDGKIAAVSTSPLSGKTTIDAKGLVVAPGFIDLHEHGQDARNYQFQAHDGVTTSLELEVGTDYVDKWYAAREGKALINYGVGIGHIPVRMAVMHDNASWIPTADAARRVATPEDMKQMLELMERGFREGAQGKSAAGRPRDGSIDDQTSEGGSLGSDAQSGAFCAQLSARVSQRPKLMTSFDPSAEHAAVRELLRGKLVEALAEQESRVVIAEAPVP